MLDIRRFLDDYNIEYWTSGKNVAEGFTNVQCPFCDDKSNHFGFTEDGTIGMCWRCGKHNVYETLSLLTNQSKRDVYKLSNRYSVIVGEEKERVEYHNTMIEVPGNKLSKQHRKYLESRNFDADYLERKYDLRGTLAYSDYPYMIITPVYFNNRIVTFQGRDYTNKQGIKYKMCEPKKEIIPIKNILYNLDNCNKKSVIVVEGIYDVLRVGDDCCSTFGISYKKQQVRLLAKKFDTIYIMFDGEPQAQEKALNLGRELMLMGKNAINLILPKGDPAEMNDRDVKKLKKELRL